MDLCCKLLVTYPVSSDIITWKHLIIAAFDLRRREMRELQSEIGVQIIFRSKGEERVLTIISRSNPPHYIIH
jgi:hypothetical protein